MTVYCRIEKGLSRHAHNVKIVGSIPTPATNLRSLRGALGNLGAYRPEPQTSAAYLSAQQTMLGSRSIIPSHPFSSGGVLECRKLGGSGGHIHADPNHSENPTTEKGMHTRSQQFFFSGGRADNKAGADGGRFPVAYTIPTSRTLL